MADIELAGESTTSRVTPALRAVRAMAEMAGKGIPAIRAAIHGARIGAGSRFGAQVVESLGVRVIPDVANGAKGIVRSAAGALAVHAKEGVSVHVAPGGGVVATATQAMVNAAGRTTVRGALLGVARAARQGALVGAAVDAAIASVGAVRGMRAGEMTKKDAAIHVGKHAARGAVAGAAGVAAAGAVSAAMAATGLTLLGAPVVVPVVTMIGAGIVVSHAFDRYFGTR